MSKKLPCSIKTGQPELRGFRHPQTEFWTSGRVNGSRDVLPVHNVYRGAYKIPSLRAHMHPHRMWQFRKSGAQCAINVSPNFVSTLPDSATLGSASRCDSEYWHVSAQEHSYFASLCTLHHN